MKQRIQNVLAEAGIDSKRHIEEMVVQGRIAVNGKVVTRLPVFIVPERDRVTIDDEPVNLTNAGGEAGTATKYYVLLNKPKDVVCTNVAQGAQQRAIDFLPANFPARVYPVGRLDGDSRGLLLLTNDGELTQKLTHPRYGVVKTYRVVVDGRIEGDTLQQLEHGVYLIDRDTGESFKTARTTVKVINRSHVRSTLELTIKEGRNRQIRRVLAKLGHKVRDLTRVRMGPLLLGDLPNGQCRPLTHQEVKALYRAAEASERSNESTEPEVSEEELRAAAITIRPAGSAKQANAPAAAEKVATSEPVKAPSKPVAKAAQKPLSGRAAAISAPKPRPAATKPQRSSSPRPPKEKTVSVQPTGEGRQRRIITPEF